MISYHNDPSYYRYPEVYFFRHKTGIMMTHDPPLALSRERQLPPKTLELGDGSTTVGKRPLSLGSTSRAAKRSPLRPRSRDEAMTAPTANTITNVGGDRIVIVPLALQSLLYSDDERDKPLTARRTARAPRSRRGPGHRRLGLRA